MKYRGESRKSAKVKPTPGTKKGQVNHLCKSQEQYLLFRLCSDTCLLCSEMKLIS